MELGGGMFLDWYKLSKGRKFEGSEARRELLKARQD